MANRSGIIYDGFRASAKVIHPDYLSDKFEKPCRATSGSAAIDLRAMLIGKEQIFLQPGQCELIGSGIAIHLNTPGYAGLILPRSGLGHKQGLVMGNGTGLVDSDYTGELHISAFNRSKKVIIINHGDRIAQYVIVPVASVDLEWEDDLPETERGAGGFGHTGVQ